MNRTAERAPGGDAVAFEAALNRRQMARLAGLHPDHWFAVEQSRNLGRGQVVETAFWGRSIALFRGTDGIARAIENRCAHRQLKLSLGEVVGCRLTCPYHGWTYDGDGKLVSVPHELFGRKALKIAITAFPVQERYGLVWLFPGDPARAGQVALPAIPELEGPAAWACVPVEFTWRAHHSMIIENVSDFTHAHLHRKWRPFNDATLREYRTENNQVRLRYDVLVGDGRISKHFVDRRRVNVHSMELCFDYPYQWSNTGDRIKHWLFLLPMDGGTTRVFFLFYFDALRIPLTRLSVPRPLMLPLLRAANAALIRPILAEDGSMVEAEQRAWEAAPENPGIELNPVVIEFQKVIIAEWRRHLARQAEAPHA